MTRKMDIQPIEDHSFEFTRNWSRTRNLSAFRKYVYPQFVDRKIAYLEIGVFEGQSLVWMLQHVLTHSDSRAVGIDPWLMTRKLSGGDMEAVRLRAMDNLKPWVYSVDAVHQDWKCRLLHANSVEALLRMNGRQGFAGISKGTVDLCMIDGDHNSGAVLDDARLVWPLLKEGGWLLFDDVKNDREKKHHVKEGLSRFLDEQVGVVERVWKSRYMECFVKRCG